MLMNRIFKSSRWMVMIAVVGALVAALVAFFFGGVQVVEVVSALFAKGFGDKTAKLAAISLIESIDLFLLGTIFYIIALGLYELFIDSRIDTPEWLVIKSLDDLKGKLISGIVVLMAVFFLGSLVNWEGQIDLLGLSGSAALMIVALAVFQFVNSKASPH